MTGVTLHKQSDFTQSDTRALAGDGVRAAVVRANDVRVCRTLPLQAPGLSPSLWRYNPV